MGEVVSFPPFELDRRSGELRKHGIKIRLADQPLQILLLLLDRPGEVIARDEIRQRLWSSDTFVDFDASLSSAVRKLRDALGDTADRPRFVETIPKRGFRFIGAVTPAASPPLAVPPVAAAASRFRYFPAAVLLLLPGYFTDVIGLLLLIPWTRTAIYRLLTRNMKAVEADGTYRQVDPSPGLIDLDPDKWRDGPSL